MECRRYAPCSKPRISSGCAKRAWQRSEPPTPPGCAVGSACASETFMRISRCGDPATGALSKFYRLDRGNVRIWHIADDGLATSAFRKGPESRHPHSVASSGYMLRPRGRIPRPCGSLRVSAIVTTAGGFRASSPSLITVRAVQARSHAQWLAYTVSTSSPAAPARRV